MRKSRVTVVYESRGHWTVYIDAPDIERRVRSVIVAGYETRASANEYAKGLRKALRGGP